MAVHTVAECRASLLDGGDCVSGADSLSIIAHLVAYFSTKLGRSRCGEFKDGSWFANRRCMHKASADVVANGIPVYSRSQA